MQTTTYSEALLPLAGTDAATQIEAKPSFFARFVAALHKSREMRARQEIARVERMMGITITGKETLSRGDLPFAR